MRFKDKIVLITGSSRGVGRSTAIAFAKEGAIVVVNYSSNEEKANSLVKEIVEMGSKAIAIKCDVSQEDQVKQMIEEIINHFGKLDILINNAGMVYDIPMFEKTVDQWTRTLAVNVVGPFLCAKYSAPYLKESKGNIVNVCSTSGTTSFDPNAADYDSSKAALTSLTKDLAKELAPEIRVNGVAPGWIDTDMNKDLPKEYIEEEMAKTLLGRMATPDEIANPVLFLASEDASYVTGSIIFIDGGAK
jgi:3-oxoacyl-[acyl-carrier protein] reductase